MTRERTISLPGPHELAFPVLCVSGPVVRTHRSLETLTDWHETMLGSPFETHLYIVDASLTGYQVHSVDVIQKAPSLKAWLSRTFSHRVRIRLHLGPPDPCSLESVKERVCAALDAAPDFWNSGGDLPDQKEEIRATASFIELADRFTPSARKPR